MWYKACSFYQALHVVGKWGHQEALACMQYDDYVTRNDLTAILKVMYPCPNIL